MLRTAKSIAGILLALLVVSIAAEDGAVVILNAQTLQKALDENHQALLFFSQEDCRHCQEFSQAYALVAKLHAEVAVFYKLTYSPDTAHFFEAYTVDSTPTVLAFNDGEQMPFRYEPSGVGNALSVQLFKWVERLFLPLKQWEGDDTQSHQLIVHCFPQQFSEFWQEMSRNQLWLDVYCGSQQLLRNSLAIVHEYGRQVEAWQMENGFDKVTAKLRRLIRAYKYKYVLSWSPTLAHEVFRNNASAFILIVNNESLSRELQTQYQETKKRWYQNSHSYEPTVFALADLSLHPAQTHQLKRYLIKHTAFNIEEYYYPIVGFIAKGGHEGKYVYNLTGEKNRTMLEQFIGSIEQHVIREEPYLEGELHLAQWLSEDMSIQPKINKGVPQEKQKGSEDERVTKILTQKNWNDMLMTYEKPFFVYFTWRNNRKICKMERQFTDWWEGDDSAFAPHRQAYDIFLHMEHAVDLPVFTDLTVDYFPSLYYFGKEKNIVKLEGVTSLQKIKNFINETYTRDNHSSK